MSVRYYLRVDAVLQSSRFVTLQLPSTPRIWLSPEINLCAEYELGFCKVLKFGKLLWMACRTYNPTRDNFHYILYSFGGFGMFGSSFFNRYRRFHLHGCRPVNFEVSASSWKAFVIIADDLYGIPYISLNVWNPSWLSSALRILLAGVSSKWVLLYRGKTWKRRRLISLQASKHLNSQEGGLSTII